METSTAERVEGYLNQSVDDSRRISTRFVTWPDMLARFRGIRANLERSESRSRPARSERMRQLNRLAENFRRASRVPDDLIEILARDRRVAMSQLETSGRVDVSGNGAIAAVQNPTSYQSDEVQQTATLQHSLTGSMPSVMAPTQEMLRDQLERLEDLERMLEGAQRDVAASSTELQSAVDRLHQVQRDLSELRQDIHRLELEESRLQRIRREHGLAVQIPAEGSSLGMTSHLGPTTPRIRHAESAGNGDSSAHVGGQPIAEPRSPHTPRNPPNPSTSISIQRHTTNDGRIFYAFSRWQNSADYFARFQWSRPPRRSFYALCPGFELVPGVHTFSLGETDGDVFCTDESFITVDVQKAAALGTEIIDQIVWFEIDFAVGRGLVAREVADRLWENWVGSGEECMQMRMVD